MSKLSDEENEKFLAQVECPSRDLPLSRHVMLLLLVVFVVHLLYNILMSIFVIIITLEVSFLNHIIF